MAVDAYALTTLAGYKAYMGITVSTHDTLLESLIDRASDWIENICDRQLLTRSYTEYTTGSIDGVLVPRQFPITAVTSVNYDTALLFTGSDVDSDYVHIQHEGRTVRCLYETFNPQQPDSVKIVYTAGYATTPDDLQHACNVVVAQMFAQLKGDRFGTAGQQLAAQVGGGTLTFIHSLPPDVVQILERYTRLT